MCRKSNFCVLLGEDPSAWSKSSPLPPPAWFEEQVFLFRDAAKKAANGERIEAVHILQKTRCNEMRTWFIEHGQMSGFHRFKRLGMPAAKVTPDKLDVVRSPKRSEKIVFARDCYTCRFCGLKSISKEVLKAFGKALGVGLFEYRTNKSNEEQHGIVHAFKVVADHVIHYKAGGATDLDNFVTSCPACNYGKYNYTLKQLGLDDPRDRPPVNSNWDGLTSLLEGLMRNELKI